MFDIAFKSGQVVLMVRSLSNCEFDGVMMNTPIRRQDAVSYWVIEDPEAIYDFINNAVRKEWVEDAKSEHRDPRNDPWLKTLSKRRWCLELIEIERLRLDPEIMGYADKSRDYVFKERLEQRRRELEKTIRNFGVVIWPLIVRKEDLQLVDGYCRHATLVAMNVSRVYVYVGRLE